MTVVVETQDLLDLRSGLKNEVLGRAPTQDQHTRGVARALRFVDDRAGFVDVSRDVDPRTGLQKPQVGEVHSDRGVARRRHVRRHPTTVSRGQHTRITQPELVLSRGKILPHHVVQLGGGHVVCVLWRGQDLADELVGLQQDVVVEQNVVDPDHAVLAENPVVELVASLVHRQPESEVGIVVEVRPGRHDPVDETGADHRDQHRATEPGGRQRA